MSEGRAGPPPEEGTGRLQEALAFRREKLERLRAKGIEPFALRFDPDSSLAEIRERHVNLEAGQETSDRVRVAGRVVLLRRHRRPSAVPSTERAGRGL
jgi:lysyl-tRNA synthetase, class II